MPPIENISSTQAVAGLVYTEVVRLPIFILQQYETPLVGMAIIIAIFTAVFGILKWFSLL